jgi:hypothetical protein
LVSESTYVDILGLSASIDILPLPTNIDKVTYANQLDTRCGSNRTRASTGTWPEPG